MSWDLWFLLPEARYISFISRRSYHFKMVLRFHNLFFVASIPWWSQKPAYSLPSLTDCIRCTNFRCTPWFSCAFFRFGPLVRLSEWALGHLRHLGMSKKDHPCPLTSLYGEVVRFSTIHIVQFRLIFLGRCFLMFVDSVFSVWFPFSFCFPGRPSLRLTKVALPIYLVTVLVFRFSTGFCGTLTCSLLLWDYESNFYKILNCLCVIQM